MIPEQASQDKARSSDLVLVVCVGNTRSTFTRCEGGVLHAPTTYLTADLLSGRSPVPPWEGQVVGICVVPAALFLLKQSYSQLHLLTAETSPMPVTYRPSCSLGADRLANALAAVHLHGSPVLAVDCGTATTLTVVDAAGVLRGGAIMPGLSLCASVLHEQTAALPLVNPEPTEGPWGEDTVSAIRMGLVLGHAGAIRALVVQASQELAGPGASPVPVVLTGGWGTLMAQYLPYPYLPELAAMGGVLYAEHLAATPT